MSEIDIVVAWVDGSDPAWLKEKNKFLGVRETNVKIDVRDCRYRDWEVFRYWFRGIEKFAPWCRKIHFVTWGHVPAWLNTKNKKINIVKHQDFIPDKYLPTFSSHPIELNFHRINGLSEKFIYFNDDMFLIRPTSPNLFFKKGKPCDSAILTAHCYSEKVFKIFTPFVDIGVINKYFNIKDVIKSNLSGWFNYRYDLQTLLSNLVLYNCPRFPGMRQQHLPTSFLKESFLELWDKEYERLDRTCSHKFRDVLDVNQWLIKEWQIAKGDFYPRKTSAGKTFMVSQIEEICDYITNQKGEMMCINDDEVTQNELDEYTTRIVKAFDKILSDKSSFEI